MEEGHDQHEEGWQVNDLRSGIGKVFAEAKRRSTLGIRVAAAWAVLILIYACVDLAGVTTVAPPVWDFVAGFGVVLLAALSISRTPVPLIAAAAVVLVDLVVVAYRVPDLLENPNDIDLLGTAIRICIAPVVLSLVVNGYFGSLSIQAFKLGFSPGADWRTRINPMMMQLVVGGACIGAVLLGVGTWFGAIRAGFEQTNVYWESKDPLLGSVELGVTKPEVEKARADGKRTDPFLDVILMRDGDDAEPADPVYPENAKPIRSIEGFDDYGKRQVEAAFKYGNKHKDSECLLEGQARQGRCRDERCRYWSRVFVRACLSTSKPTENYCADVPDPTDAEPGLLWAQRQCAGRNFEICREIIYAVQGHCHPPEVVAKALAEKKAAAKVAAEKAAADKALADKAAAEKAAAEKAAAEKAAAASAPADNPPASE